MISPSDGEARKSGFTSHDGLVAGTASQVNLRYSRGAIQIAGSLIQSMRDDDRERAVGRGFERGRALLRPDLKPASVAVCVMQSPPGSRC